MTWTLRLLDVAAVATLFSGLYPSVYIAQDSNLSTKQIDFQKDNHHQDVLVDE